MSKDISRHGTSAPLLSGATYQTPFLNIERYESINIILNTDVEGSLFVEYSIDATTIDFTNEVDIDLLKINGTTNVFKVLSRFARIRYLNGGTNQTTFRLQITLKETSSNSPEGDSVLISNNSEIISNNTDLSLVRITNDPRLDVALGLNQDIVDISLYGALASVGTSLETIWKLGGNYDWLTTATTLEVVTIDVADDASGLGAQTIVINGLDVNFDEISEVVSLVGSGTSSATTQLFYRVNTTIVLTSGSDRGSNFNDIIIQGSGGGNILNIITGELPTGSSQYGHSLSQMCVYTVPSGKQFVVRDLTTNVPGTKLVDIMAFAVFNPQIQPSVKFQLFKVTSHGGLFRAGNDIFDKLPEKTDLWFEARVNTGSSSIDLKVYFYVIDLLL